MTKKIWKPCLLGNNFCKLLAKTFFSRPFNFVKWGVIRKIREIFWTRKFLTLKYSNPRSWAYKVSKTNWKTFSHQIETINNNIILMKPYPFNPIQTFTHFLFVHQNNLVFGHVIFSKVAIATCSKQMASMLNDRSDSSFTVNSESRVQRILKTKILEKWNKKQTNTLFVAKDVSYSLISNTRWPTNHC